MIPITYLITHYLFHRRTTVKTVIHMMYQDVDVDLDLTELETPEQIKGLIDNFVLQGFKAKPKFVKQGDNKHNNSDNLSEIKFISEGKTKNAKLVFFLHVLTDDMPED